MTAIPYFHRSAPLSGREQQVLAVLTDEWVRAVYVADQVGKKLVTVGEILRQLQTRGIAERTGTPGSYRWRKVQP